MSERSAGALVRAPRRRRVTACATVRQDLCRMAVGARASLGAAPAAAHARRCPACAAFADDVARVRSWLGGPFRTRPADASSRARAALARELGARLARDLLGLAGLAPSRRAEAARADVERLRALLGPDRLAGPPWAETLHLLHARGDVSAAARTDEPGAPPVERAHLLAVAARLDPLGLDVGLGHLAMLERCGRRAQADADADGLLARLG
jgi:hypothetical protein